MPSNDRRIRSAVLQINVAYKDLHARVWTEGDNDAAVLMHEHAELSMVVGEQVELLDVAIKAEVH